MSGRYGVTYGGRLRHILIHDRPLCNADCFIEAVPTNRLLREMAMSWPLCKKCERSDD